MINHRIHKFRFDELSVNPTDIEKLLGFEEGTAYEPFPQYIREVLDIAGQLNNICGSYLIFGNIKLDLVNKTLSVDDTLFMTGKIVTGQLKKATSIAVFICTAGHELEAFAKEQMKIGNMPEAYIADIVGSVIVEAAMDKMQEKLASEMKNAGMGITNRYSPGYCSWNVREQQKLFHLLPEGLCNIELAESSLMHPIKSISGVIGIGKDVKHNAYTCKICDMNDCIYRNIKNQH